MKYIFFMMLIILVCWPPHPGIFAQSPIPVTTAKTPLQTERAKETELINRINNNQDTIALQIKNLKSKKEPVHHQKIKYIKTLRVDTVYLSKIIVADRPAALTPGQVTGKPSVKLTKKPNFFQRLFHRKKHIKIKPSKF